MRERKYLCFLCIIPLVLISCTGRDKEQVALERALAAAGDNRLELEKVLARYSNDPADSLKYRAACFLIRNMPYHYYYEGEAITQHATYFQSLHEHKQNRAVSSLKIRDSITALYGRFDLRKTQKKYDILEVDSAYLCANIEWSFKVWREQPWGKHIDFEAFCERILPYRIKDEVLVDWKSYFYEKYNPILTQLLNNREAAQFDDPVEAAKVLMDSLNKREIYFTSAIPIGYPHVGPMTSEYLSGTCRELTDFAVYVYRALGIPCQLDFMPMRSNHYVGHDWVSLYDRDGVLYCQDYPGNLRKVSEDYIRNDPKLKVYRSTYGANDAMIRQLKDQQQVPALFATPTFGDVTEEYAVCYAAKLSLPDSMFYEPVDKSKVLYMAASSLMNWTPVAFGKQEGKQVVFSAVQKGGVYRLMYTSQEGKLRFLSDPFILDCETEDVTVLNPSAETADVTIYSKFPLHADDEFRKLMVGGVFEGSHEPSFKEPDTLHVITELPYRLFNTAYPEVKLSNSYQYIRYKGPANGYLSIAELSFFKQRADSSERLVGRIIGHSQDKASLEAYAKVFDGGLWSSYRSNQPSGDWVGFHFDRPERIDRIVYTPRNRDNYIKPDNEYELFYLDGKWKSLGLVKSTADSLYYENVPKNTLLYLKNRSGGVQERIFTYENSKVYWR